MGYIRSVDVEAGHYGCNGLPKSAYRMVTLCRYRHDCSKVSTESANTSVQCCRILRGMANTALRNEYG